MTFKKTEKEIIEAIVKYGDKENSMAKVLNLGELLEKRGIVIAFSHNCNYVFTDKQKYDYEDAKSLSYISELISLIKFLIDNRLITVLPIKIRDVLVLGRKKAKLRAPGYTEIEDAFLEVESTMGNWMDKATKEQMYWPSRYSEKMLPISTYLDCWFSVSQELKDLVKNGFKTEEQIRFVKQQRLTWLSIFVALLIGLLGIFCK